MNTRSDGRLWQVVSVGLILAAFAVVVLALIADTPQKDSGNWYLLGAFLALGGTLTAVYGSRRKTADRQS